MTSWKSELHSVIIGLSRTHPASPITEISRILQGVLDVDDVYFVDRNGSDIDGNVTLQDAIERGGRVIVRFQVGLSGQPSSAIPLVTSRFREGAPSAELSDITSDPRFDAFVREFLRLEQHHEFMWAGYVVRELLPRLGFQPEEAKLVLDRLRADNLVTISKVHNPKNPDFPATGVQLNREHPRVEELLGERTAPAESE